MIGSPAGVILLALKLPSLILAGTLEAQAQHPRAGDERFWAEVEGLHTEAVELLLRAGPLA